MNAAAEVRIRRGTEADIPALLDIEKACFSSDLLSRRSFRHFLKEGPHSLLVATVEDQLAGYVLLLYRRGTNLARIYSIAVPPRLQGRGIARQLVTTSEAEALRERCVFLRLEVRTDNDAAIALYTKMGYRQFDRIQDYYEDGGEALRMEKRIHRSATGHSEELPYYQQTTDFTCGPASLMMAMHSIDENYAMTRQEELQIWREATTIFMTSGHGGCSPHGLALSAWRRGFRAELYINHDGAPFLDSVRSLDKKAIIELVHDNFLAQIHQAGIPLHVQTLKPAELQSILHCGGPVVALISTWGLNRSKAPHWVFVSGTDSQHVYVNDPEPADNPWHNDADSIHVPISLKAFTRMACFGRSRLRSLLVLGKGGEKQDAKR